MSKSKKPSVKKPATGKKPKAKPDITAAVEAVRAKDAAANAHAVDAERVPIDQALKAAKQPKAPGSKTPKAPKVKKVSGLDAAAQVLKDKGEPMHCKDIVQAMLDKGLWQTRGKTPAATMYSAILREITTKGPSGGSRFTKTDRGLFAAAKGA
ncbi:MAG: winged helix-turn-helix domain-containing protein [Phycisphaerales bacterium]